MGETTVAQINAALHNEAVTLVLTLVDIERLEELVVIQERELPSSILLVICRASAFLESEREPLVEWHDEHDLMLLLEAVTLTSLKELFVRFCDRDTGNGKLRDGV